MDTFHEKIIQLIKSSAAGDGFLLGIAAFEDIGFAWYIHLSMDIFTKPVVDDNTWRFQFTENGRDWYANRKKQMKKVLISEYDEIVGQREWLKSQLAELSGQINKLEEETENS